MTLFHIVTYIQNQHPLVLQSSDYNTSIHAYPFYLKHYCWSQLKLEANKPHCESLLAPVPSVEKHCITPFPPPWLTPYTKSNTIKSVDLGDFTTGVNVMTVCSQRSDWQEKTILHFSSLKCHLDISRRASCLRPFQNPETATIHAIRAF